MQLVLDAQRERLSDAEERRQKQERVVRDDGRHDGRPQGFTEEEEDRGSVGCGQWRAPQGESAGGHAPHGRAERAAGRMHASRAGGHGQVEGAGHPEGTMQAPPLHRMAAVESVP